MILYAQTPRPPKDPPPEPRKPNGEPPEDPLVPPDERPPSATRMMSIRRSLCGALRGASGLTETEESVASFAQGGGITDIFDVIR